MDQSDDFGQRKRFFFKRKAAVEEKNGQLESKCWVKRENTTLSGGLKRY